MGCAQIRWQHNRRECNCNEAGPIQDADNCACPGWIKVWLSNLAKEMGPIKNYEPIRRSERRQNICETENRAPYSQLSKTERLTDEYFSLRKKEVQLWGDIAYRGYFVTDPHSTPLSHQQHSHRPQNCSPNFSVSWWSPVRYWRLVLTNTRSYHLSAYIPISPCTTASYDCGLLFVQWILMPLHDPIW